MILSNTIFSQIPIEYYFVLSSALFCIGLFGLMYRRNAIIMFMCVEMMLNSVNLLLVALSVWHNDAQGQVFVFFIMGVAAAEVTVGLAILVSFFRNKHTVDTDEFNLLKG
jgi:NADH-quinone oxidoreductase subunit K